MGKTGMYQATKYLNKTLARGTIFGKCYGDGVIYAFSDLKNMILHISWYTIFYLKILPKYQNWAMISLAVFLLRERLSAFDYVVCNILAFLREDQYVKLLGFHQPQTTR